MNLLGKDCHNIILYSNFTVAKIRSIRDLIKMLPRDKRFSVDVWNTTSYVNVQTPLSTGGMIGLVRSIRAIMTFAVLVLNC